MNAKRVAAALGLSMCVGLWATTAGAVCNQTSASLADNELWGTHGCWSEYFLWHFKQYDTNSDDWGDRGYYDACNPNLEYAKHWNAAFLISYGLAEDLRFNFHSGIIDYQPLSEARESDEWHDGLRHQATDTTAFYGKWSKRSLVVNLVQTSCLLYTPNLPTANASPGSRAGDFVHEGTHAWLDRHGYENYNHLPQQGKCTFSVPGTNGCDWFYWHGLGVFNFGAMWQEDGTANRFHSPNQSQVEFLCDVADFPAAWVPASVRIAAASDASQRALARFINGPGYACGSTRPW